MESAELRELLTPEALALLDSLEPSTSTDEPTIETTIGTVDVSDVPEVCDKLLAAGRYSDWYKLRSGLGLDTRLPPSPCKNV